MACSATLKAALKQTTLDPLVRVVLTSGASSYTYALTRLLAADEVQEPYSHTAELVLDNSDGEFTARDLRGYQAVIGWGAVSSAGAEYCDGPPLRVIRQELVSEEGKLTCRLLCIGIPEQLAEDRASDAYVSESTDTTTVQGVVNAILAATMSCYTHCDAVPYQWDSTDSMATSYKPRDGFRVYTNGSRLAGIRRLLDFTTCVMRVEDDGKVHLFTPTTTGTTYDQEFSLAAGSHAFFQKAGRQTLVIPNRVIAHNPEDWPTSCSGSATDAASYALLPKTQYQVVAAASNAEAAAVAACILAKYQLHTPVARLTVPLTPAVRPLDYVKVTDARLSDSVTGNVGLVRHRYAAGGYRKPFTWQTDIELGGWSSVRALANKLEVYPTPQGYDRLNRLVVKDLEAENIRADNIVLEWLTTAGDIDLSKIGDDLDSLGDGTTYAKLKKTSISAGNILLSSAVEVKTGTNSKWYDIGYVEIDSDYGITISGQDLIFELGTEQHYIYPSSGELDIMSESGCDIRFLNGPVKLSCDLDPKTDSSYDLGSSSYRYDDVWCDDLHVTTPPWDSADDLALVRAMRADPQDGRKYDRSTIPPMLRASHRKAEKVEKRRRRIDRDHDEIRAILDREISRETRPEKKAMLLARRSRVGSDREARIARYAASLDDDSTLSVGNAIGLLIGSVRQLADQVDALTARLDNMKGGE